MVKEVALELKVDDKIDMRLVPDGPEGPRIGQVFQRAFNGSHQYPSRSVERDLACEAFPERAEADDQIRDNLSSALVSNMRAAAPWNKSGIVPYVRYNGK